MRWLKDPRVRMWFAAALFVVCVIGWPLSAFTWAKDEPPFILGLSWWALILTALDIIATTDVRVKEDEE